MKDFIHQFLYLLDAPAKKSIPLLIMAFLLSSILDVFGIGLIGIFFGMLANPQFFVQKFPYFSFLLKGLTENRIIFVAGLLIVGAFLVKGILTLVIQARIIHFCQMLSVRLKAKMMKAYQNAPYTYYLKKNSAYMHAIIVDNLHGFINGLLMPSLILISNGLIAIFILSFLLILHPFLTLSLLATFLIIGICFDLVAKKKLSIIGKQLAEIGPDIGKSIFHGLHGFAEIRVLGKEDYFLKSVVYHSKKFASAFSYRTILQSTPRYLIENVLSIFIIALSLGGIIAGYDKGSIVAMVVMFAAAGSRLLPSATMILATASQLRGSNHNMNMIYNDLIELDQITDHSLKRSSSNQLNKLFFSEVKLQDVSYQYPQANQLALQNINLRIKKGQSIGLIGPSGAGKSSLVNLILGFLEPKQGEILVDNKPIKNLREWLNNFAYIPQSIFILDDNLRHNIALGIEDEHIDDARIWEAINMAQLTEVVNDLPEGLETSIGQNGIRLSGGQRQRVALARAFYHERDIIIMDEATSSLDNETEKEVINTIKRLKGNKTLIVIAHRLSTVEHCDVLYRLEKGTIVEEGSFQEVIGATT